jgi:hypothetical protein
MSVKYKALYGGTELSVCFSSMKTTSPPLFGLRHKQSLLAKCYSIGCEPISQDVRCPTCVCVGKSVCGGGVCVWGGVCVCVCVSVCVSVSVCVLCVCKCVCVCVVCVRASVCLSLCLSACLSVYLSD